MIMRIRDVSNRTSHVSQLHRSSRKYAGQEHRGIAHPAVKRGGDSTRILGHVETRARMLDVLSTCERLPKRRCQYYRESLPNELVDLVRDNPRHVNPRRCSVTYKTYGLIMYGLRDSAVKTDPDVLVVLRTR